MTKIFISYGKEDKEIALNIRDKLEMEGYSVAMPEEELSAGAMMIEGVTASIASSALVVGVITQKNIGSAWVNQELGYAMASGKPTYLVLGDKVNAGGLFSGSTSYVSFTEEDPEAAAISVSTAIKSVINARHTKRSKGQVDGDTRL